MSGIFGAEEKSTEDQEDTTQKRRSSEAFTRERTTRKTHRVFSPHRSKHKSLPFFSRDDHLPINEEIDSNLNIDDIKISHGFGLKVVLYYSSSGKIVMRKKFDKELMMIIKNLCLYEWRRAINYMSKYQPLEVELMHIVERKVMQEAKEYSKSEGCLK